MSKISSLKEKKEKTHLNIVILLNLEVCEKLSDEDTFEMCKTRKMIRTTIIFKKKKDTNPYIMRSSFWFHRKSVNIIGTFKDKQT